MPSSYDEEIFERGQWSFALPQRLRHVLPYFRGAFNLAIQSASASFLQRALPRLLSRALFFNYIFFTIILIYLLFYELLGQRSRRHIDRDLFDVIRRLVKHIGWGYMVLIFLVVFALGEVFFIRIYFGYPFTDKFLCFLIIGIMILIRLLEKVSWSV